MGIHNDRVVMGIHNDCDCLRKLFHPPLNISLLISRYMYVTAVESSPRLRLILLLDICTPPVTLLCRLREYAALPDTNWYRWSCGTKLARTNQHNTLHTVKFPIQESCLQTCIVLRIRILLYLHAITTKSHGTRMYNHNKWVIVLLRWDFEQSVRQHIILVWMLLKYLRSLGA